MDELDAKLASILAEHDLPTSPAAIARVRRDVEAAKECALFTAPLEIPKPTAIKVVNTAKLLHRLVKEYNLANDEERAGIQRLAKSVEDRLSLLDRPESRPWLGPFADYFKQAWEALTTRPSGLHYGDEPSPALKFVTACSQIINPTVNTSAVLRAYRKFMQEPQLTPEAQMTLYQSKTSA